MLSKHRTTSRRSSSTGRFIARSAITGRFLEMSKATKRPFVTVKLPAAAAERLKRRIERERQREAARAETTAAMAAAARGDVIKAGRTMKSVLAALNAGD